VLEGAGSRPGSVTTPPARRDEPLVSDESDDAGASGELLREVHSILSSRDHVRQGARLNSRQEGVVVRRDWSDPVDSQEDDHPREIGARDAVVCRLLCNRWVPPSVTTVLGLTTFCGALLPEDMDSIRCSTDVLTKEIHLQGCYRVLSCLAFLVNLYQREMNAVLRGVAVVEMCADQIEMMTTGRHTVGYRWLWRRSW